jgi:hypothetical protein
VDNLSVRMGWNSEKQGVPIISTLVLSSVCASPESGAPKCGDARFYTARLIPPTCGMKYLLQEISDSCHMDVSRKD